MVLKLPPQADRVETGPIQFGDDWPGVFIRGDNALYFATALRGMLMVIENLREPELQILRKVITGLCSDLESCDSRDQRSPDEP